MDKKPRRVTARHLKEQRAATDALVATSGDTPRDPSGNFVEPDECLETFPFGTCTRLFTNLCSTRLRSSRAVESNREIEEAILEPLMSGHPVSCILLTN